MRTINRHFYRHLSLWGILVFSAFYTTVPLDDIPETMGEWTEQGTVLRNGNGWDNHDAWFLEDVVKANGKYYLYFCAGRNSSWGDGGGYSCIGVATSSDGKNFSKHSDPIIRPEQAVYVSSWEHGVRTGTVLYKETMNGLRW